jgi:hypothetical protein
MAYIRNSLKWMMEHLIFKYRNKFFKLANFSVAILEQALIRWLGLPASLATSSQS